MEDVSGMSESGLFVVFEGIDGSGTTTQMNLLHQRLRDKKVDALMTFEPTGSEIGEMIRRRLRSEEQSADWRTMALLFAADRQEHTRTTIWPALSAGKTVICDRYHLSTVCYQLASAHAQLAELATLKWLSRLAAGMLAPHVTFVLDVPIDQALERVEKRNKQRGIERDVFEQKEFQRHVAAYYLSAPLYLALPNVIVLNGARSEQEIADEVWSFYEQIVEGRKSQEAP